MFGFKRKKKKLTWLGPCVGAVTPTEARVWIHCSLRKGDEPVDVTFTLHENRPDAPPIAACSVRLTVQNLFADVALFDDLKPDTRYQYRVWKAPGVPLEFEGLETQDLHFTTFPADERLDKLDFLLMSCHDPDQGHDDGQDGFKVWGAIDQIRENNNARFAILAGDQIYGDHVQEEALASPSSGRKLALYLGVYERLWNHPNYRKALCSMPTFMMWDDHDITDGWGSRSDSFLDATSDQFRPEWLALFNAARGAYVRMQAIRCPKPLLPEESFDYCFKVGRTAFVVADLRSHRNVRKHQVWSPRQLEAIKEWVYANRDGIDSLFFVSPVVVTHGWPNMEHAIRAISPFVTSFTQALSHIPGLRRARWAQRLIKRNIQDVGGFRDDLEDAWASDPNNAQAEELLDFLFSLQNPPANTRPIPVIILSGDIHAAGYSMVYSCKAEHQERPVIEHVCSSPIGSEPMSWIIEGLYQQQVSTVPIGTSGSYSGQVSHHHCHRNVVALSLRRFGQNEMQLKMKFYLENLPQPEVIISDLMRVSRREEIDWDRAKDGAKQGGVAEAA